MDKKELIVTNTLWYKIHNFFRNIFSKKNNKKDFIEIKTDKNSFMQNISYRNEITNLNKEKELAEGLMNGTMQIIDLSDAQVDEMTEYFTTYINDMNQKLEQIKNNILNWKNKK